MSHHLEYNHVMVSAILLAAGEAKRLGRPKMLMSFGNSTILEQSLDSLLASMVDEVIVVLGKGADNIRQIISDRQVAIVVNPYYRQGMSTSLKAGLTLVDERAQRILVALGDQPLVSTNTYDTLIRASINSNKGITIPVCQGKRGNPVIFAAKYKYELKKLTGDVGGREIVKLHPDDILEVAIRSEGVTLDINTIDDYAKLQNKKVRH